MFDIIRYGCRLAASPIACCSSGIAGEAGDRMCGWRSKVRLALGMLVPFDRD
jgi:hypothetical protein